ncbi:hypothetical protein ACFL2Q_13565, partial [Thermodesulfobacteriota bacterium]
REIGYGTPSTKTEKRGTPAKIVAGLAALSEMQGLCVFPARTCDYLDALRVWLYLVPKLYFGTQWPMKLSFQHATPKFNFGP